MKKSLLFVSLLLSVAVAASALGLAAVSSADETTITGAGSTLGLSVGCQMVCRVCKQDRRQS